jgi:hypothetical protein
VSSLVDWGLRGSPRRGNPLQRGINVLHPITPGSSTEVQTGDVIDGQHPIRKPKITMVDRLITKAAIRERQHQRRTDEDDYADEHHDDHTHDSIVP